MVQAHAGFVINGSPGFAPKKRTGILSSSSYECWNPHLIKCLIYLRSVSLPSSSVQTLTLEDLMQCACALLLCYRKDFCTHEIKTLIAKSDISCALSSWRQPDPPVFNYFFSICHYWDGGCAEGIGKLLILHHDTELLIAVWLVLYGQNKKMKDTEVL